MPGIFSSKNQLSYGDIVNLFCLQVLVGMEGVWGTVLMWGSVFPWAYILPGSDNGSLENVYDSWVMIKVVITLHLTCHCPIVLSVVPSQNSQSIQFVLFGFFITVMLYNVCGILVTKLGSSMWHTILDNFRPVSVWVTDLLLFYAITNGVFGEAWTPFSFIQLAGDGWMQWNECNRTEHEMGAPSSSTLCAHLGLALRAAGSPVCPCRSGDPHPGQHGLPGQD